MANILVIDDDLPVAQAILNVARSMGHSGQAVSTLKDGLERARNEPFDLIFLEVRMPDGSGLDILPAIREVPTAPEVIIITGFGDPDGAELAIREGAWDYLEKPLSAQAIRLPIERALQYKEKKTRISPFRALNREGIIGESAKLKACFDALALAAMSDASVLISGETGTGKELFAWAIHKNSHRQNRYFVVVDCAALPETLVESSLFGHVKGAFTGADQAREGLIKQADGGTLFLDEVGELSLRIQKAFLRVLQEKRFRPVGGEREVRSDFRLISATNRDLAKMVKHGRFREDLFFRLRTLVIEAPPLRDHLEDLKALVLYYSAKLCDQYKVGMKDFSPGFWDVLRRYDWPGNIRELIQALEKAILAGQLEPTLYPKHMPEHIRISVARAKVKDGRTIEQRSLSRAETMEGLASLNEVRKNALANVEREYLANLMKACRGNIAEACRISELSKSRLYGLLKKYDIMDLFKKF